MGRKIVVGILLICAVGALVVVVIAAGAGVPVFGPVGYLVIFLTVPLVAAWGVWRRSWWGAALGLVFFLPQCINFVGQSTSFYFMAPISFSLTMHKPDGTVQIVNLFAIVMVTIFAILLYQSFVDSSEMRENGEEEAE